MGEGKVLAMASASTTVISRLSLLYTSSLLAITLVTPIYGHNDAVSACCNLKLMDTSQQVVIETGRALTPGVYRAASVQVCTTEEMLIQVWTPINNETYQLKWRTQFTPTAANTLQTWVTVTFGSGNALTVATNDRLGLYGTASLSGLRKLAVPYAVDDAGGSSSVQLSRQRFNESFAPFDAGQLQITVQDVSWPRTFEPYLRFCTNSDCSDVTSKTSAISTTRRPTSDLPFCGCQPSCSPDEALNDVIDSQQANIDSMQEQVTRMRDLIRSMTSATVQTGFCPDDFAPGLYGIGSCYVVYRSHVQLGEAAVRCSADHGANLVAIESDIEQRFIYSIVTNNGSRTTTGSETFWTSGMYSTTTQRWMWYRQDWTPRSPIASNTYRGWRNNAEPRPTSDLEACLVIDVDADTGEIYWRNDICIYQNYYICEIPKICY